MRLKPGDHLDRFEIIEPLGEGAYAETYKARDTRSGQTVLIKSPNPLLFADPAIHQRFVRESEIARRLKHPGLQASLDTAENRTEPYLAMEYIEGDNLRRWLRAHDSPLALPQAVGWGRELAEALGYLHTHKVVHRDLKPENVIVTRDGHLKIIDFGTALLEGARRLTWRHLTEALGTPDYMSPEQIQGERGDNRSDIYAWGIMMYELLTGQVPFRGDNYLAVMAGHLQRNPEPIRKLRPEVPEDLETVVLSAMRRYPENRYQTAEELLAELNAVRLPAAGTASTGLGDTDPGATAPPHAPVRPVPRHSLPPLIGPAGPAPAGTAAPGGAGAPPRFGSARPAPPGGAAAPSRPPTPYTPAAASRPAGGPPPAAPATRLPPPRPVRDLSPEKPIGKLPAPASEKGMWILMGAIAGGFIVLVAVIILVSVALRHH